MLCILRGLHPITALKSLPFARVVLLVFCSISAANATDYTFNETFDLSSPVVTNSSNPQEDLFFGESNPPTFQLNVGDTISGTITFANNQELTIAVSNGADPNYFTFALGDNSFTYGDPLSYTESVTLLGLQGNLATSNPAIDQENAEYDGAINIGESSLTASTVTFTGFEYTATVIAAPSDASFVPSTLAVVGDTVTVNAVPEPTPFALVMCGGVILFWWRRHSFRSTSI